MDNKHTLIALALPLASLLVSCGDTSTIGQSIVQDKIEICIDTDFSVSAKTIDIDKVQSRTISQLIGRLDAVGFGKLSSDVVTQFMPAAQLDTDNIKPETIDSLTLELTMAAGEFIGDSVAPMGLTIYPLTKPLPSPIYSDFDPEDYYDHDKILASTVYNVSSMSSGIYNKDGSKTIRIKMPTTLGQDLYNAYVANPSSFGTPSSFAKIFPGIYIKNSFGSGRLTRITSTVMKMHYHYFYHDGTQYTDSVLYGTGNYFAVTPEIITNNNIAMTVSPKIDQLIADGENVLVAPVGKEVQITFPATEIISSFHSGNNKARVLNTLSFSIPAYTIANDYNIAPPQYVLLVLSNKKDEFFAKNSLPDNITSFYATYDSSKQTYDFGEMRAYLTNLLSKDNITVDDYTFSIVPVSAMFETNQQSYYYTNTTLSMLTPYVASPVMCRLDIGNAEIKLTYSTQTVDY